LSSGGGGHGRAASPDGLVDAPRAVAAWAAGGELRTLAGRRVFVRARAGAGTPLLLLHGFPTSSFDFHALWELLGDRALATLDLPGFGLSEKPPVANSLLRQADVVEAALADLGIGEAALIAHDMGTSVATELLARALDGRATFTMRGALLFNGSIVIERASLTAGQRLLRSPLGPLAARLTSGPAFRRALARTFSPGHPMPSREADAAWWLMHRGRGERHLHRLVHYLGERTRYADRWHGAIRDWPGRLELLWGLQDPVATTAVLGAVRSLRPQAPVHELADLGHYPHLEDPPRVAAIVRELTA
jgi:pimeloyl-ACP methyl ester carboxylesterase